MDEMEVLQRLKAAFKVRSSQAICDGALEAALAGHDARWIKQNFSNLVEDVQERAYGAYLEDERRAGAEAFRQVLGSLLPEGAGRDDFFRLLEQSFWALDRFYLGLTQGRKPRAGKTFERVIRVLFEKLGYPYSSQPIINGQPDFLLPSVEHFQRNAMDCIIFTVKRTLRERWRQIVTEGTRGYLFFLATIDDDIAARDLPEMLKSRIYVVVPESIRVLHYAETDNVISFERFFEQHLDPAMERWRKNRVIR